ncbi:hypothetical protein C8J98_102153 [Luteibacter sp. OK325]|uniref:lactate dehydrogenase n=1 Tax=Luteibacter sp. OK325 TaxID=2135670 RepID=UPI000D3F809A|nr:lactate dehydrogenase [Luteibacter sp. OK325]PTR33966.1 hypothetical protein C8J98_102153 [Luteibacter sp. OK325]
MTRLAASSTGRTAGEPLETKPAVQPSVVISLSGAGGPDTAATYPRPSMPVWQMHSDDAVTMRIARQYNVETNTGRFSGIGAALVGQFGSSGADFAQSVSLHPSASSASTAFNLKITTASGKAVTFSLMGSEGELAVQTTASDGLDDSERAAVAKLADGFQSAIDGMAGQPPKLDLTALAGFDKGELASVDFSASTASDGQPPMTLALHADATSRAVKVTSGAGTIDIGVDDASAAILGTGAQRTAAMANYLDQIDKATARGHGDRALAAMFKDAFTELNAADDAKPGSTNVASPQRSKSEHAMLSGLADFHASFAQRAVASNPMHPDEVDGFSYDVSQSTHMGAADTRNRELSQQRSSHLLASFHSPLSGGSLALTGSPSSQNYLYTQIDDKSSSQADIAYRNGIMVKAALTLSASQSTHQMKYVMGKLVEDTMTPVTHSATRDALELLDNGQDDAVNQSARLESDPSKL